MVSTFAGHFVVYFETRSGKGSVFLLSRGPKASRTWTSFSLRVTRLTISMRSLLSGLEFF
jgi:hypothetical protein